MTRDGFIVIYDDEQGLAFPYGFADDCEGALDWGVGSVALFDSKAEARKAIEISARWAKLRESQGKPHNTDFTQPKTNIKVLPVVKRTPPNPKD